MTELLLDEELAGVGDPAVDDFLAVAGLVEAVALEAVAAGDGGVVYVQLNYSTIKTNMLL